jgi:hypothetical protein
MTEQQRINKDFEHFKATGDDYPYCQRMHDKTKFNRFVFASMWIGIVTFCVFVWIVVGELIVEMMR